MPSVISLHTMDNGGFVTDAPDVSLSRSFPFPPKSIRFYPVEIRGTENSSNLRFMNGSTNLNEKVAIAPSIPFSSSGNFIHRRKYNFLGGCSLKRRSRNRLSSLNIPAAPNCDNDNSKYKREHQVRWDGDLKWKIICWTICNSVTIAKTATFVTCSNPNTRFKWAVSGKDNRYEDDNDADFNSPDLVVGLEISSGVHELHARTIQHCHFDNNPAYKKDRSVMITLKFNNIRAVIQAHGHLDECSQFVKVDLGIGDRVGEANRRDSSTTAGSGKRFSCVLTSTFPYKPTHPNQCVLFGRLCSITELESAVQECYYSSSCQQGIVEKSGKETGKLNFLQGHIFVSIWSGDYDLEGMTMRQSARLQAAADGTSVFEQRLQDAEKSEGRREGRGKNIIYFESSNEQKYSCDWDAIKCKSSFLAEMIEIHGHFSSSGEVQSRVLPMKELEAETVSALISYFNDFPLKQYGTMMISCCTAISLIEVGRKYKIHNLEKYICQLIIEEREPSWFDIKSLVKLFRLCHLEGLVDSEKVKYKVIQAFQMKHRDDDKEDCVKRLFKEDPDVAAELLMEALTICSKIKPKY